MKLVVVATSALLLAASPAFAGGFDNHSQPTSPQFAGSSALNYAVQAGSIRALFSKGSVKQVTGAGAEFDQ